MNMLACDWDFSKAHYRPAGSVCPASLTAWEGEGGEEEWHPPQLPFLPIEVGSLTATPSTHGHWRT